ncbi:MAG: tRNA threonylcarbamoyladenosine dehydratase [Alphaproteobacteria bacterium]|jgi:tRNA A37 threonylcarbamoyladenosine dehydratase|nr:tRNA threonylcarbamoyladenosine dehydratase [Alphaproteobacteria bacterium]
MLNQFSRSELVFGKSALKKLATSRVAVFGLGGVGSYVAEALARSGIGHLDLIDNDTICLTNLNRQLFATHKTIGQFKVDVAAERIADINPDCNVTTYKTFYLPENKNEFDFTQFDYVVDAIDTVAGKIGLIVEANNAGIPIISAMGAGNKVNPAAFEVADIYKTSVCPLAHVMRKELRKRGIKNLKVVYSKEPPLTPLKPTDDESEKSSKRQTPGSTAFTPPVVGLIIAGEVVKDLIQFNPLSRE